jgi:2-keto-3-deoxy-L-rhamnonate aldolase RhmA
MFSNWLRERIGAGKRTLTFRSWLMHPDLAEAVARLGFYDCIEFAAEYGNCSEDLLSHLARAVLAGAAKSISGHILSTMIKVPLHDAQRLAFLANRSGIPNVLFADCQTVDDVRSCVQAVRPQLPGNPRGQGISPGRQIGYGYWGDPRDFIAIQNEAVIALMVEKPGMMDILEELPSIKGWDMLQFGPADMAIAMGYNDPDHREVKAAETRLIDFSIQHNIPIRVEINSPDQAQRYLEKGIQHFALGVDILMLLNGITDSAREMDRWISAFDKG